MKVNKFILAGVAVLGLGMTACNNDDVPSVGNPTEGNTIRRNVHLYYERCHDQGGK